MAKLKILMILLRLLVGVLSSPSHETPESCLNLYDEGSVPALLQSHECAFGLISPQDHKGTMNCEFAILQGRREYQEDRVSCDLDMHVDFLGESGSERLKMGMVAVFDGHGGDEASDLAARLLHNYFQLHLKFLSYKKMGLNNDNHLHLPEMATYASGLSIGRSIGKGKILEIIKEALVQTIHDIDFTFSQAALKNSLLAGSTATIVLIVNDHMLVANVGDSKAVVFSENLPSGNDANNTGLSALVLTNDHHPDRDDEKARIEGAGGFVSIWGVPRVNGILAVSRAIGDVYLKRYGLIADPELKGWIPLNVADKYLVVASDGIFESLKPEDISELLWDARLKNFKSQASSTLADHMVTVAYEKGSTDNLSAVVVSLSGWTTMAGHTNESFYC